MFCFASNNYYCSCLSALASNSKYLRFFSKLPLILTAILIIGFSFLGGNFIEKSLSCWTIVILLSAIAFFFATGSYSNIPATLANSSEFESTPSMKSGFMFALYNSALIPVLIYSINTYPMSRLPLYRNIQNNGSCSCFSTTSKSNGRLSLNH